MGATNQIDVSRIAALARIELNPENIERLQKDMEGIVGYIEQLSELDVEGIEPTAHAVPLTNVLRDDTAKDSFPHDVMMANAPENVDEELIKVPQVLPGEGMS